MKKVIFKNLFVAFLAAVSFLFVGMNQTNAQSSELYGLPTGNFLNVDQAKSILENTMMDMKPQFETLIPGTALYKAMESHYVYYNSILSHLDQVSVAQSIVNGFDALNDTTGYGNLTEAQLNQLKADAVFLLSN